MQIELDDKQLLIIQEALGLLIYEYSAPNDLGEEWDEEEALEYQAVFDKITEAMDLRGEGEVG